ncbi:MAG: hypothetical protein HKN23_18945 [Verrucomicrobiales bacterium]|nr:hypothetical protein [Verrucomicrobiales bacterium]
MKPLVISSIPDSGLHLKGQFDHDIFDLADGDDAKPAQNVRYDLKVSDLESLIFVTGTLYGVFDLTCTACLERFPCHLVIPEWEVDFPLDEIENEEGLIDLTERIREDLLLELPTTPRCEDWVKDRVCPGARSAHFESSEHTAEPDAEGGAGENVWDALDDLGDSDR